MASMNTHDTPTCASHWRGDDIEILVELSPSRANQLGAERANSRAAVVAELIVGGCPDARLAQTDPLAGATETAVMSALYVQLAASSARDVVVTLEDLWLEARPINVHDTGNERPNWRRPLTKTLDEIAATSKIACVLGAVNRARRG